jgi:hypothetical protein
MLTSKGPSQMGFLAAPLILNLGWKRSARSSPAGEDHGSTDALPPAGCGERASALTPASAPAPAPDPVFFIEVRRR